MTAMRCGQCVGERLTRAGRHRSGRQLYRCSGCGHRRTERSGSAFSGYRFPPDVIALAVRWYLCYRLSYADLAELLEERGVLVDPSTLYDWVQRFTPLFLEAARPHRAEAGRRWRVDETYVRVNGHWQYLFRAIDEHGQVLDCLLSPWRDSLAARDFFHAALNGRPTLPTRIITDKAACYPAVIRALFPAAKHRTRRYLNNRLERDHQHLKGRLRPMRGFKAALSASTFCRGHALLRNLRGGHSALTADRPPGQRLVGAWSALVAAL